MLKPGSNRDLTNAEYHQLDSVSNSRLSIFRESRKRYFAMFIEKTLKWEQTKAQLRGSVVHAMQFEPAELNRLYAVMPKFDMRRNADKAAYAKLLNSLPDSCELVDAAMWSQAKAIDAALRANSVMQQFMAEPGDYERPLFWTDPATGLACRCKPDKMIHGIDVVLDLKVVIDSTPGGFAKAISGWEYDCQAAWYIDGYKANFGIVPNFVFVAVCWKPPYEIGFYELEASDIEAAREINAKSLASLKACMEQRDWKSPHERSVVKVKLPRYAANRSDYRQFEIGDAA